MNPATVDRALSALAAGLQRRFPGAVIELVLATTSEAAVASGSFEEMVADAGSKLYEPQ